MKYKTHVRKDWKTFVLDGQDSRLLTECGSRVKWEFVGIPGVTKPTRPWCGECLDSLSNSIVEWYTVKPPATSSTKHNHAVVASELMSQEATVSDEQYQSLVRVVPVFVRAFRPLWDRRSRTNDNRLFVVWSSLIDRCMDRTNPQYEKWGGAGWTVCERWIDFNNFVSDMPPTFTAGSSYTVNPNGFSKVLGPKSTVVLKKSYM